MRGHVFINGAEKRIKCAYIGVNGKAQYTLKPPGINATDIYLNVRDGDIKGFTTGVIGNYILVAGGSTSRTVDSDDNEIVLNNVTAFDKNFTKSNAPSLSRTTYKPITANTKNYILIGGGNSCWGYSSVSYYSTNNAYNKSLTKVSCPSLYHAGYGAGTTTLSNSAFYAGGCGDSEGSSNRNGECRHAYIINNSLTLQSLTNLGRYADDMTNNVATVGNYAIVGYGSCYYYDYNRVTDAYNSSFSKVSISSLSYSRSNPCMIGMKSYAITASCGGKKSEAYDTSLTKILAEAPAGQNSNDSNADIIGKYNSMFGYGVFMWDGGGICYYDDDLTMYQYTGKRLSRDTYIEWYNGPYCVSFGKYIVGRHSTSDDYDKGKVLVVYECSK